MGQDYTDTHLYSFSVIRYRINFCDIMHHIVKESCCLYYNRYERHSVFFFFVSSLSKQQVQHWSSWNVLHFIKRSLYTMFKLFSPAIFTYVLCIFLAYPSYTEKQQIWSYIDIEITCLKEHVVTLEIKRTFSVKDMMNISYVAARKLCVVADSPVKIWPCTLSSKIVI